jgi:hypothetical protein
VRSCGGPHKVCNGGRVLLAQLECPAPFQEAWMPFGTAGAVSAGARPAQSLCERRGVTGPAALTRCHTIGSDRDSRYLNIVLQGGAR